MSAGSGMVPRGRLYVCTSPGCTFRSERYRVVNHVLREHLKPEQAPFSCAFCSWKCISQEDLHKAKGHKVRHEKEAAKLPPEIEGELGDYVQVGDQTLYKTFLRQLDRQASQQHFQARQRPGLLARAAKAAGICASDESVRDDDPETMDTWADSRLLEAPARWGKDRGAANWFGQLPTDLRKEPEAEPLRKVARKLNGTGVPAAIPHEVGAVTVDPRSKEVGDSPVLRLVGDVWEPAGEVPKSSLVNPEVVPAAHLKKLQSLEAEVTAMRREMAELKAEVVASREDLGQLKTQLATSNSEKTLLRQTLQKLITVLPPNSVQQFPVVDGQGKPVSVVAIEQVSGVEAEQQDHEETEE